MRVAPLPTDWQCKFRISPNFHDRRSDGPVLAPLALTGRPARTAGGGEFLADEDVGNADRRAGEASLVATTVIEVGVNVPNASVMIIENTERFGLSQLHQLRGRVGRGAEQSYCILMSSYKLSKEAKSRIQTMVRTNNGFEIAEADLKLRGPGSIEGTQQSGILNFRIADLARDGRILQAAREIATRILDDDFRMEKPEHQQLKHYLEQHVKPVKGWSRIS